MCLWKLFAPDQLWSPALARSADLTSNDLLAEQPLSQSLRSAANSANEQRTPSRLSFDDSNPLCRKFSHPSHHLTEPRNLADWIGDGRWFQVCFGALQPNLTHLLWPIVKASRVSPTCSFFECTDTKKRQVLWKKVGKELRLTQGLLVQSHLCQPLNHQLPKLSDDSRGGSSLGLNIRIKLHSVFVGLLSLGYLSEDGFKLEARVDL